MSYADSVQIRLFWRPYKNLEFNVVRFRKSKLDRNRSCCWAGADRAYCLKEQCSMLTKAIPGVEISVVFARSSMVVSCNLFAKWHQRLWLKRWGVWGDGVGRALKVVKSCFLGGTSYSLVQNFRHNLLYDVSLSVTDRRTDWRLYSLSYCVHYDRLKQQWLILDNRR